MEILIIIIGRLIMNRNFKYELDHVKLTFFPTLLITSGLQFIILFGFFEIGFNDHESANQIFENVNTLWGFCTLLTITISSIYSGIRSCHSVISDYMNDNKIRLYLFPKGRGPLLINKIFAFTFIQISAELVSLIGIDILYLLIFLIIPKLTGSINLNNFIVILSMTLFSSFSLITSMVIGIVKASKVATTITSVIISIIFANLMARITTKVPVITLAITLALFLISLLFLEYGKEYINHDELER